MPDLSGARLRMGRYWDRQKKNWADSRGCRSHPLHGIAACPVDWDADGDLDLLLGSHEGRIFLRLNQGSRCKPAFATENIPVEAAGQVLHLKDRHAMPVAADWDGDGLWDLVTGSEGGAVRWFRNLGERGAPRFDVARTLIAAGGGEATPLGKRTQVAVADFDADGRMDLLVGDAHSVRQPDGKWLDHGYVWLFRRNPPPSK